MNSLTSTNVKQLCQNIDVVSKEDAGKITGAASNQSNSTLVTLGKRERSEMTNFSTARNVRQKQSQDSVQDGAVSEKTIKLNVLVKDIAQRKVKSAHVSANGSNNLDPQLDIKVNLPTKDESDSDEFEDESLISKEKR